jgi:hypothetical protein
MDLEEFVCFSYTTTSLGDLNLLHESVICVLVRGLIRM